MRYGTMPSWLLGVLLTLGPILILGANPAIAGPDKTLAHVLQLPKASLLVEAQGRLVISRYPDRAIVPASTIKVLTALAAIRHWGPGPPFSYGLLPRP